MRRESSGGFTMVETMIVLGITGVMFVSMASMISGQQSKARFKSAIIPTHRTLDATG
jgi:type II secretory pathway pseudopilin PulG